MNTNTPVITSLDVTGVLTISGYWTSNVTGLILPNVPVVVVCYVLYIASVYTFCMKCIFIS